MKFCNCTLGGTKACEKCARNTGVSSEYYAQLERNKAFIDEILGKKNEKKPKGDIQMKLCNYVLWGEDACEKCEIKDKSEYYCVLSNEDKRDNSVNEEE